MAIVNLTPDSFWQEVGILRQRAVAVERAVRDGASVIDLGPQSTRPGYTEISAEDEIERLPSRLNLSKGISSACFRGYVF
ncbi:MAG: dihydropteroate synthase [Christensenellaceae bacterium]